MSTPHGDLTMARSRKPKKGDIVKIEFGYGTEGGKYPSTGSTTLVVTRCFKEDGETLCEGTVLAVEGEATDESSPGDVVVMPLDGSEYAILV